LRGESEDLILMRVVAICSGTLESWASVCCCHRGGRSDLFTDSYTLGALHVKHEIKIKYGAWTYV